VAEPILAGVAESELGETPDRNWLDNAAIATVRALEDAGCSLADVDGVAVAGGDDYMPALVLSEYLDLDEPSFSRERRSAARRSSTSVGTFATR